MPGSRSGPLMERQLRQRKTPGRWESRGSLRHYQPCSTSTLGSRVLRRAKSGVPERGLVVSARALRSRTPLRKNVDARRIGCLRSTAFTRKRSKLVCEPSNEVTALAHKNPCHLLFLAWLDSLLVRLLRGWFRTFQDV